MTTNGHESEQSTDARLPASKMAHDDPGAESAGVMAISSSHQPQRLTLLESPAALVVILAINVVAYVAGVLWWYGPPLNDPETPLWVWPFVPDCPLFGLVGGLALLKVVAYRRWSPDAQRLTSRTMAGLGAAAILLGCLTLVGWIPVADARAMAAMWSLAGGSLLLVATLPGHPLWLAAVGAVLIAGQIKYGIWTLTLWGLYWRNTNLLSGAPLVSAEGVLMVVAHLGLIAQGLVLLFWLPPTLETRMAERGAEVHPVRLWGVAALAVLLWFSLSDIVDYVLGHHPAVHQLVSLETMRISTQRVTWLVTALFLMLALQSAARANHAQRQAARTTPDSSPS